MKTIEEIMLNYLTKDEHTIVESFGSLITDYGSDLKNQKWITVANAENFFIRKLYDQFYANMWITFFKHDEGHYMVFIAKDKKTNVHTIGFKHSKNFNIEDINNNNIKKLSNDFKLNRSAYGNALGVFNKVFYVALKGVKEKNIKEIFFFGVDNDLGKVYSKLMKNKNFHKVLNENGYVFDKENDGRFFFVRKEIKNEN